MKTNINIIITLLFLVMGALTSCQDELEETPLQIDFYTESQNVVAGEAITFTDVSEGNPSRWRWKFEGGTPAVSELSAPEVLYEMPGTYSVQLTVGKRSDSVSIVKDAFITVDYGSISIDFEADNIKVVQGESITFTDKSQGLPTSWLWEFIPNNGGNALTSSEQNPTIVFDEFGVYSVKLTATNPKGSAEMVKNDYVTILDASSIEANFSAESQGTYEGGSIQFNDATLGTVKSWSWSFDGGTPATSNEQNPVVSYDTPGRYKVKLVATNDYKSSEKEIVDYVLVVPSNGLVAFYPFDGNTNDAGPNKVNATNKETGTISFDQLDRKATNQVASFDGASALVAPDNDAFNFGTNNFSIACWVKTDITSKMMIWQESGANGGGDNQAWLRIGDNTSTRKMRFAVEDDTGGTIINSDHGVSDNAWHHVVCTRSGTTSNIYVDGVLVATKEAPVIKNVSNNQDFKIGAQERDGGGSYASKYNGLMDELIVYNRTLSITEIENLFNQ